MTQCFSIQYFWQQSTETSLLSTDYILKVNMDKWMKWEIKGKDP